MNYKIGQKVYIRNLDAIGVVESINESGQPVTIKVGDRIIRAIDYIIEHAGTIIMILTWLRKIFK